MKFHPSQNIALSITCIAIVSLACNGLIPLPSQQTATPPPMEMSGWQVTTPLPAEASGIDGITTYADGPQYHNHVDEVGIPADNIPPPLGGHFNAWQNCGIYEQPVELGLALHSLEHGAVWLTYSPDLRDAPVSDLKNAVRGHDYVLMSPYPNQPVPVVLTAWGIQLILESLPDQRIEQFIDFYENGPQNPEPGAPCSGAVGNPLP